MEIKVSTALETALEFISEVATCKEEEYKETFELARTFTTSLYDEIDDRLVHVLRDTIININLIRGAIIRNKKEGK